MTAEPHVPVMVDEVLTALAPADGRTYVDGTFGAGGYSRRILAAADCRVIGIDRDATAIEAGEAHVRASGGRLLLRQGRFGDMADILAAEGVSAVDGIALDLGVSSMQIDRPERGFSFRADGPLDMRMGADGPSASEFVNGAEEREIARVIHLYGEERHARRIARRVVAARRDTPIERTAALAAIVRDAYPAAERHGDIDPATRTFQAIRIHVNDELGELERGLDAAERMLRTGGRLAIVSFHSLEDRIVKQRLRAGSTDRPRASRHLPGGDAGPPAVWRLLSRKAIRPGEAEIARNPRARSARMRAAERLAPAAGDQA